MKILLLAFLTGIIPSVFAVNNINETINVEIYLAKAESENYGINWGAILSNESQYTIHNGNMKISPTPNKQIFTISANDKNTKVTSNINEILGKVTLTKRIYAETFTVSKGASSQVYSSNVNHSDVVNLTFKQQIVQDVPYFNLSSSIQYVNSITSLNDKMIPHSRVCKNNWTIKPEREEVTVINACRVNYNNFLNSINNNYQSIQNSAPEDAKLIFIISLNNIIKK